MVDAGAAKSPRSLVRECRQELHDALMNPDRVRGLKRMSRVGDHEQLGLRDAALEQMRILGRDQQVLIAMHDQHRAFYLTEPIVRIEAS